MHSRGGTISSFYALLLLMLSIPFPLTAQTVVALAVEGWQQESRADGVIAYKCASTICAAGSVVSYKAQPHRGGVTLADFARHHEGLAARNTGQGSIRDVRMGPARERMLDGVRVLQIARAVDWADGTTTHTIEARLIGKERSYSLVSDSPRPEWTASNYEGFLARLAEIAGIESR